LSPAEVERKKKRGEKKGRKCKYEGSSSKKRKGRPAAETPKQKKRGVEKS